MTHRERFIKALKREPFKGRVPHFELVFFLTMESFGKGLKVLPDAKLLAVGSRSKARADEFGDQYAITRRYGSYEELANDPDVDIIYVASPHPFHREHSLLCLRNGKEKS
jgi:predicted dehydrogenase